MLSSDSITNECTCPSCGRQVTRQPLCSMSDLVDIAEFSSADFAPALPEECQVNPEVYGAELAFWLCQALARSGVATSYPESDDWCWSIGYQTESGSEFEVHCCNVEGSDSRWLLTLR